MPNSPPPDPDVLALIALCGGKDNKAVRAQVADAIHASEQTLYQIVNGIPLKSGKPRGVGRDLRGRLDREFPGWRNEQPAVGGVKGPQETPSLAQQLSHPEPIMVPRTIDWESLMSEQLPPFFRAVLPDDAMGIDYPKGAVVNFTTTELPARARDLVLVADSDGAVYFREFQQGRGDKWQAVALVSGYAPLDSESDGLRVLAISMGRWGRRG